MDDPPIILIEFNELCPPLIERWIAGGALPNFARLKERATVFTTRADVDHPGHLEPWIQWYSLHTGLSFAQHGVFHLTEGARADHVDIWRALAAAGKRVGSFASMNARPFAFPGSFYVADPWSESGDANPPALNHYGRFVAGQVREHTNPDATRGDRLRFLRFMARHGLSAGTVAAIARQLLAERFADRRLSWRRAALLDRLQFDAFRYYYRRTRPDFASFFLNSTAHFQHSYWRQFEPERFAAPPTDGESALLGDAIAFGYRAMDGVLGRFLELARESGARVIFATALSQQPYLDGEATGGRHFWRLRDVEALFHRLRLRFATIDPTMTHQYLASFADEGDARAARMALEAIRIGDKPLFDFNERTREGLYFSCDLKTDTAPETSVLLSNGETVSLGALLYKLDATKSGRHHPDGALWIEGGAYRTVEDKVSILDVFPTVLDMLGADPGSYPDRTGVSLLHAV